jgi:hypothetical protein
VKVIEGGGLSLGTFGADSISMRSQITTAFTALVVGVSGLTLLFFVVIGVVVLLWHLRTPDRKSYAAKNDRIVRGLPRTPGAREVARGVTKTEDSWGEQLSHTVGYATDISYAVPRTLTQQDIIRLYKKRLAGWHQVSWTVDGTLEACFDRDGATVAVDTTGMDLRGGATQKTYAITVDHNGGNCD